MSGFGDSLTTVGTTQLHPLGTIVVEPATQSGPRANQGEKHWIYVYNDDAVNAFAVGTLIQRDDATSTYDGIVSTGAVSCQRIIGVSQHAIAVGSYGFILRKGIGTILCDANVTANSAVCPDANAGQATDVGGVTDAAIAVALAAGSGAGTTTTAYIDCKG